jgi:hypothetical protein
MVQVIECLPSKHKSQVQASVIEKNHINNEHEETKIKHIISFIIYLKKMKYVSMHFTEHV